MHTSELTFNIGQREGTAQATGLALLKILRRRGTSVDATSETRIRGMRDPSVLRQWLDQALEARTAEDMLATPTSRMSALEMIHEDGRAEGLALGYRASLIALLRARGLQVDTGAEARIRETQDLALLNRWLDRAVDASTVEEVLAG